MKKLITIVSILAFLIAVPATGAFAFLDDNSVDNSTNATASVDGVNATANQNVGDIIVNNNAAEQKDLTTSNNRGHGFRSFNAPAEITYPGMPSYFGPASKNSNVQPAKVMTMFKKEYTRAEILKHLNGTAVDHSRTGYDEAKATDKIVVIFDIPNPDTVSQTALITTSAKNKDTESKDVLFAAILSGLDSGADLLLITAEGAGTILKSFGWGLGISYTRASINADETTGGVGAGGLGIAGAEAGYKSLPWIQAIGLKLK